MRIITKVIIGLMVFAFSVYLLFYGVKTKGYQNSVITIEVASGDECEYQLFYNTGLGYGEKESVSTRYSGEPDQVLKFVIPGAKIKKFRIDPGINKNFSRIRKICIEHDETLHCWSGQSLESGFKSVHNIEKLTIENNLLLVEATGHNPQFEYVGDVVEDMYFVP